MHHVVDKTVYYQVSFLLAILLLLTVTAAQFDLGHWNVPIALAIALAKAVLIVLFFMHIRYGSPLLRLFAVGGFLWLLILFALTAADVLSRG
jgi:cytochrome c oxidase subunit IV